MRSNAGIGAPTVLALNRKLGLQVFEWLVAAGDAPSAVMLPRNPDTYARQAAEQAERQGIPVYVWGDVSANPERIVHATGATLFVSVHFPELLPEGWLTAFGRGCVNVHPALLPWGRGWHTPTWAILDGTPFGATIHYMSRDLDGGDVIAQEEIAVRPDDTAHSLYQRVLDVEYRLFQATWPLLREHRVHAVPQDRQRGSSHAKSDLDAVRRLDLGATQSVRAVVTRLRALTTDRWTEAAWFEDGGQRYAVRVEIRALD